MRSEASRWCAEHRSALVGARLRDAAPVVTGAGFDLHVNGVLDLPDDAAPPSPRGGVLLLVDVTHRVTGVRAVRRPGPLRRALARLRR